MEILIRNMAGLEIAFVLYRGTSLVMIDIGLYHLISYQDWQGLWWHLLTFFDMFHHHSAFGKFLNFGPLRGSWTLPWSPQVDLGDLIRYPCGSGSGNTPGAELTLDYARNLLDHCERPQRCAPLADAPTVEAVEMEPRPAMEGLLLWRTYHELCPLAEFSYTAYRWL